jgi:glycosyltransferase involved in cell wall biosynthesis
MPRILIVTFSLFPPIGGAEMYVLRLSKELVQHGYDVSILCREWVGDYSAPPGVRVKTVAMPTSSRPTAAFNLMAIRQALTSAPFPDIVNVHDPFHYFPLGFFNQLTGAATIVTSHGVTFDNPRDAFSQNLILYHTAKLASQLSTAVIANDRHFLWWCNLWRVPKDKVFYVPNGVDVEQFKSAPIPHKSVNVLVPRNLVEGRGVQVTIEAAMQIRDKIGSNVKFYIAGDGPLRGRLVQLAKSKGLSETFVFLGRVPHERMNFWYNMSDIVVVPTLWSEGTSLAALEAMSCGVPVIASRIGGLPDIVNDDVGRLVTAGVSNELALALRELILDENLRLSLGANARRHVMERFTLSKWLESTMDVFEWTLRKGTSRN